MPLIGMIPGWLFLVGSRWSLARLSPAKLAIVLADLTI